MDVEGDYQREGYALIRRLLDPAICSAFLNQMAADLASTDMPLEKRRQTNNLLKGDNIEVYGFHYPPMLNLLWGLTPIVSQLVGRELLPSYDYFRIYAEGDICRVHSDRPSCEHSLSLTLDYSDGVPWDLEVATDRIPEPSPLVTEDFGDARFAALTMEPGDAVLYEGVHHRHGRVSPNPNGWSAHLFLHWVDPGGPYADRAFDGNNALTRPINFASR